MDRQERIKSAADELQTAILAKEMFFGWDWGAVLGYLTDDEIAIQDEYLRQSVNGAVFTSVKTAYWEALDRACLEIAAKEYDKWKAG